MIRWQAQPTDRTCGQTAIAMVLGVRAHEVMGVLGDRPTTPRDLAVYLQQRGRRTSDRLVRLYGAQPPVVLAIVRVLWDDDTAPRGVRGHWIVWHDGRVLDPSDENIKTIDDLRRYYRITSYIEVSQ